MNLTDMGKKIEDEIHQNKFRNALQKVQLNILFTAGWIETKHACIFKKYNITTQQYNVLRILKGSYPVPCSLQTIKDRMLDRMSDASRLVERLRQAGYIQRIANQEDRRCVNIIITAKGISLIESMEPEEKGMDNAAANISVEEAEMISALLDKLRD